jgi:DNA-binding response OmpR family regulator
MSPSRPENRQPTVLLIEDDEDTRFAWARTFAGAGYLALSAPTAHDAVAIVAGEAGPVDAVVLDVLLPDAGGVELCARLRQLRPDLPVVVCSGEAWREEVARLQVLGVFRYFRKPVGPEEVLAAVGAALRWAQPRSAGQVASGGCGNARPAGNRPARKAARRLTPSRN